MDLNTKKAKSAMIGLGLSLFSIGYSFQSSCTTEKRDLRLKMFEMAWKEEDDAWYDSNMVQAARNDSLLRDIIDRLEALRHAQLSHSTDHLLIGD